MTVLGEITARSGRILSRLIRLLCLCLAALGFVVPAGAAIYSCVGTIDWISVGPGGVVTVSSASSGLDTFYPCNINSTAYGVTPATCTSILATLLTAKAMGSQVTWNFNDSLTCNRATYNSGNWYWLNDGTSVWYYGPQIQ